MKNPSFRFLWLGQMLANAGDVFYIVALMSMVYEATESVMFMALLPFIITMARFISGFLAPILIDKYSLKSLLVYSQTGKTIFLFLMYFWNYLLGGNGNLMFLYVMVFLISFLDGWATPAKNAMLPRLVQEDELLRANSFVSILDQSVQLGGWAAGGVLVAWFGGDKILLLTLCLFVISTLQMCRIRELSQKKEAGDNSVISKWESIKEGWVIIWKEPVLRILHVVMAIESVAYSVWIAAILYVFVDEVLQMSVAWWGYINAAFMIGLIFGGVMCLKKSNWMERNLQTINVATSFAVSILLFAFGANSVGWMALLFSALLGVFEEMKGLAAVTILQKNVSEDLLPKIYSAQGALTSLIFGISSFGFGFLADLIHVRFVFLASGFLLLISALYIAKNIGKLNGGR